MRGGGRGGRQERVTGGRPHPRTCITLGTLPPRVLPRYLRPSPRSFILSGSVGGWSTPHRALSPAPDRSTRESRVDHLRLPISKPAAFYSQSVVSFCFFVFFFQFRFQGSAFGFEQSRDRYVIPGES